MGVRTEVQKGNQDGSCGDVTFVDECGNVRHRYPFDAFARFATIFAAGSRPQGQIGNGRRRAGLLDLEDINGNLTTWLRRAGHRPGTILVLRPDKFVFGVSTDATILTDGLRRQLGLPRETITPLPAPPDLASQRRLA